ncbi:MAG TPA: hypothetical protein VIL36_00725, partial [Acidimicrobiales bacterium]
MDAPTATATVPGLLLPSPSSLSSPPSPSSRPPLPSPPTRASSARTTPTPCARALSPLRPLQDVVAACLRDPGPTAPAELAALVDELRTTADLDPLALDRLLRRLSTFAPGALEVVRHLPDLVVANPPGPSLWAPATPPLWT